MNCFCLITSGVKPKAKELRDVRLSASSNTINNTNYKIVYTTNNYLYLI